jgi:hypothetical protein
MPVLSAEFVHPAHGILCISLADGRTARPAQVQDAALEGQVALFELFRLVRHFVLPVNIHGAPRPASPYNVLNWEESEHCGS